MRIVKRPPLTNRTGKIVIADRAMREKPEACWKCPVANEYTMCMLSSKVYEDLDRQYEDCPLMEVEQEGEVRQVKCRDCKWLTADKRSSIGHECLQPEKKSAWDEKESKIGKEVVARYKQPSMKACKMYEPKEDLERDITERLWRARYKV